MRFDPPPKEAEFLEPLRQNASEYFGNIFKGAIGLHGTQWATSKEGEVIYFLRIFFWNMDVGLKNRVLIINDLGLNISSIHALAQYKFDSEEKMQMYSKDKSKVASNLMPLSPKLYIYTNKLHVDKTVVSDIFFMYQPKTIIEVIDESKMFKTIFISYGGPDEKKVEKINYALKAKGINTWFFAEDGMPGDKLHRVMTEGVYKYDFTLLVCSENSLTRTGVLNEIERMLEREAKEGGREIIIPIAIDDYVFNNWNPEREDIKAQITSRIIKRIDDNNFDLIINRIIKVLQK